MSPMTGTAARPQLIRALNEQSLLEQIRRSGPVSKPDLARTTGLSKPTVGVTLANLEQAGLVQPAGVRTGSRGPAAVLFEVRPEAGFVLALDVGREYLRGAVADLAGDVRAHVSIRARASSGHGRVAQLVDLADELVASAGIGRDEVTQSVIGSPGVYDPQRRTMTLARSLPGWQQSGVSSELRQAFGEETAFENDVDAAALAEHAHSRGRDVRSLAFVSVGTGVGLGLVLDGRVHRGAHGAAGEIAYLPLSEGGGVDPDDARRRGQLEAAASAAAVVRAARRSGSRGSTSARRVFAAANAGEAWAQEVVAEEVELVAKAILSVVAVVDPELVVLGGGIGRAPGFCEAVVTRLRDLAPVVPDVHVSALGDDAVVAGCITAGVELAWERLLDRS